MLGMFTLSSAVVSIEKCNFVAFEWFVYCCFWWWWWCLQTLLYFLGKLMDLLRRPFSACMSNREMEILGCYWFYSPIHLLLQGIQLALFLVTCYFDDDVVGRRWTHRDQLHKKMCVRHWHSTQAFVRVHAYQLLYYLEQSCHLLLRALPLLRLIVAPTASRCKRSIVWLALPKVYIHQEYKRWESYQCKA